MDKKIKLIRKIAATISFIVFIVFSVLTSYEAEFFTKIPTTFFLKIDPFAVITSSLTSRILDFKLLLVGSILLIVTLIFGRFFCSWVCPFGYLNQAVSNIRFNKETKEFTNLQYFKYHFLAVLLILSIFGIGIAQIFDPISITERTFALGFTPILSGVSTYITETIGNIPLLNSFESSFNDFQYYVFPSKSYYYNYAIPTIIIFVIILLLNLYSNRFWCNYICPLGALLGVISNFSFFKVRQSGNFCKSCSEENICQQTKVNCHGNANPSSGNKLKHFECMICGNCLDVCPSLKLTYSSGKDLAGNNFQPEKRYFLLSTLIAILSGTFFKKPFNEETALIRPPGALKEDLFIDKCINCGKCVRICPNNAIQLTFLESKLEDILTPHLIPRMSYCEYYCNACSQICPTGAIKSISVEEKILIPIGKAHINKNKCITYKYNRPCLVCEQVCPVPEKAIKVINENGIGKPIMDNELCIGCGKCEYKCPVGPDAAIVVSSEGAKRLNP